MTFKTTNSSTAIHIINLVLFIIIAVSLPRIFEYVVYSVTPFEFNVNHIYRNYSNVCAGDRVVKLDLIRSVRPKTGVEAEAITELIRFEDGRAIETDWKETRAFVYQQNDMATTTIEVLLPAELGLGTYGFIEHVIIYPMWGVEKRKTFFARDAKFEVIDCNL